MIWQQLIASVKQKKVESFSDLLTELGAVAVTLQQHDVADEGVIEPLPGETPLWTMVQVTGLFTEDAPKDQLLSQAIEAWLPHVFPEYTWSVLFDRDWERVWLDEFKPMQFGQRLWIIPSVYESIDPDALNIRLDPGLAFGTGTHATTALCLEWLVAHLQCGWRVIDYGCGSGILSIAAVKLGAASVYGIDIDPQAWQATQSNATANAVTDKIMISGPTLDVISVDLLIANIVVNPLVDLVEDFARYVAVGGMVVLSGLLTSQVQQVKAAYQPWFHLDLMATKDDWCLLSGVKQA